MLTTPYPVVSELKQQLLNHLNRVSLEQARKNRPQYLQDASETPSSPLLNAMVHEHEAVLRHKNRLHIENQIKEESLRENSAAIIRETIYKKFGYKGHSTSSTFWINYNSLILKSKDIECDINVLANDHNPSDLIKLGQKELHYRHPESNYKKLLSPLLIIATMYYSKRSSTSDVLWKIAMEENEYRIKIGTPLSVIGDFTFTDGKLSVNKIYLFGKNIFGMVKSLENSVFGWQVLAGFLSVGLACYGLYKTVSIFDGSERRNFRDEKK